MKRHLFEDLVVSLSLRRTGVTAIDDLLRSTLAFLTRMPPLSLADVSTASPFDVSSMRGTSADMEHSILNKLSSLFEDIVTGGFDIDPRFLTNQSELFFCDFGGWDGYGGLFFVISLEFWTLYDLNYGPDG